MAHPKSTSLVPVKLNLPVLVRGEDDFRTYAQMIKKFPMLDLEQEMKLAKAWQDQGDIKAAQKLVESHLRLVVKIAMGFRGYGLPISEMISEGNIGLLMAVNKYDYHKGFRLSTYAMWWIKAAIQEYVLRSWSVVKVGSSKVHKRLFFNLRKIKRQIEASNHSAYLSDADISEIADILHVPKQDVMLMDQRMSVHDQSLDAPVQVGEDKSAIGDLIADENQPSQDVILYENQEEAIKRDILLRALDSLSERERDIIQARKMRDDPATLEDLSQQYGISKERVRQIEQAALSKMTTFAQKMILDAGL